MAEFKMAGFKAIICASAIALGIINVAEAADLLPPPPPIAPVVAFGNWYIRGDVGVGIDQISDMRSTFDGFAGSGGLPPGFTRYGASLNNQINLGGGFGYQFNHWFRADLTGEYRTDSHYKTLESYNGGDSGCGYPGGCFDGYTGSVNSTVFLANGYFDIGTWYGITPFIGGGVGFSRNKITGLTDIGADGAYGVAPDHSKFDLAWAVMAGASFSVTQNLKIELGYRYLDMGSAQSAPIHCLNTTFACSPETHHFKLASHDIRLGFRYTFADYVPAPAPSLPPPPLVRKY